MIIDSCRKVTAYIYDINIAGSISLGVVEESPRRYKSYVIPTFKLGHAQTASGSCIGLDLALIVIPRPGDVPVVKEVTQASCSLTQKLLEERFRGFEHVVLDEVINKGASAYQERRRFIAVGSTIETNRKIRLHENLFASDAERERVKEGVVIRCLPVETAQKIASGKDIERYAGAFPNITSPC